MAVTYSESSASTDPAIKRVSWGAIFVGVVIAMVVQLLLGVLGLAIGATAIDPQQAGNPLDGVATFTGVYWILSSIVSLFAGGFAAGSLATAQNHQDRTLHGLTVWGLAMLLMFFTIGTGVGGVIGGAASIVGGSASIVGDAVSSVAPQAADAAQRAIDEADIDLDLSQWREEARQFLRDAGDPALRPDSLAAQSRDVQAAAGSAADRAARNPQSVDTELEALFDRIQNEARETLRAVDREALVNVVVARTDQSRQQAQQTVANWEEGYEDAWQRARVEWDAAKAQAEETAREWGDEAADAIATAAWWTFISVLLGGLAAAGGANVGANRVAVIREDTDTVVRDDPEPVAR